MANNHGDFGILCGVLVNSNRVIVVAGPNDEDERFTR